MLEVELKRNRQRFIEHCFNHQQRVGEHIEGVLYLLYDIRSMAFEQQSLHR